MSEENNKCWPDKNGDVVCSGPEQITPPLITPTETRFKDAVEVKLINTTPGAKMLYATDGTIPLPGKAKEYKEPIKLTSDAVVSAVSLKNVVMSTVVFRSFAGGSSPTPPDPPEPPTPDVLLTLAADTTVRAISPSVFGVNVYRDTDTFPSWAKFGRSGGNLWSLYNYKNNASNSGHDWQNWNTGFLSNSDTPSQAVRDRVNKFADVGSRPTSLITIPMLGYGAADKVNTDVTLTPDYLTTRFVPSKAWTPGVPVPGELYQNEFIGSLMGEYGYNRIAYALDNEPDLWHQTHEAIQVVKQTYAGYIAKAKEFAFMIRECSGPTGLIFGPVCSGWYGFQTLGGAIDAAGRFFIDFFLQQMAAESSAVGKRLLDILDLHWYVEHRAPNGVQVLWDDTSSEVRLARMQGPRSLWDPTFVENSWITNDVIHEAIQLIPRMNGKINSFYPGTGMAFTEYNFGGSMDASGGVAQADALGIFCTFGVYAANFWPMNDGPNTYAWSAFKAYENFGDNLVTTSISDVAKTSFYAAKTTANGNVVGVCLNKTLGVLKARIDLQGRTFAKAVVYVLNEANSTPTFKEEININNATSFIYDMPAMSVSRLEFY